MIRIAPNSGENRNSVGMQGLPRARAAQANPAANSAIKGRGNETRALSLMLALEVNSPFRGEIRIAEFRDYVRWHIALQVRAQPLYQA